MWSKAAVKPSRFLMDSIKAFWVKRVYYYYDSPSPFLLCSFYPVACSIT
jgi:hypothetical protein